MINRSNNKKRIIVMVFGWCLTFQPILMAAPLPTNPNVRHGDVNINTSGNQMDVNQNSQYGIVDWESFSIDSGYGVNFNNGAGSTLNRVTGVEVSNIYGNLSATGNLYLLNSNGVIIGEGGQVLTGGDFVASTMDITNEDFLNGGSLSLSGNSNSAVTNLGVISSSGGNVLLAGYRVTNEGSISASEGSAGLVAGTQVDVLTDLSWANGRYAVSLGERDNNVTNTGRIEAMVAELRTHNGNIYALAGNNEGLIHATGVNNQGGKVLLTAEEGLVQSSGQVIAGQGQDGGDILIDASTVESYGGLQDVSGEQGGTLTVRADSLISDTTMLAQGIEGDGGTIIVEANNEVLLTGGAIINADGAENGGEIAIDSGEGKLALSGQISANGSMQGGRVSLWGDRIAVLGGQVSANGGPLGGEIYIGGGYQGESIWNTAGSLLDVQNSQRTYISENSLLTADAGFLGKGGTVVVWSDGVTEFAGQILARGGIQGGHGGLVETSGLEGLGVSGTVDANARAAYGNNGQWLLDPKNINIGTVTDPLTEFQSVVATNTGGQPADFSVEQLNFGNSLAVSGNTIVVGTSGGSPNTGLAYIFEDGLIAARLTPDSSVPTGFPYSSDITPPVLDLSLGQSTFGREVAVVTLDGPSVTNPDVAVAVLDPGQRLTRNNNTSGFNEVQTGVVYFYLRGDGWQNGTGSQVSREFNPHGIRTNESEFGTLENLLGAYSGDGSQAHFYFSDPGYDASFGSVSNVGRVYLVDLTTGGNTSLTTIQAPVNQAGFGFGTQLAVDDGPLFIGANYFGPTGIEDLYIFDTPSRQITTVDDYIGNNTLNTGDSLWDASGSNLYVFGSSGSFANATGGFGAGGTFGDLTIHRFNRESPGQFTFSSATAATLDLSELTTSTFGNPRLYTRSFAFDGDTAIFGNPFFDVEDPGANNTNTGQATDYGRVLFFSMADNQWANCTSASPCIRDLPVTGDQFAGPRGIFRGEQFGHAIAIDGNTAAISSIGSEGITFGSGSIEEDVGEVRIFSRSGSSWLNTQTLVPTRPDPSTEFGTALDIDGNTYVVGDRFFGEQSVGNVGGRVYVYENDSLAAVFSNGLRDGFGREVAISGDRIAVIAGLRGGDIDARAYLFERGGGWQNGTSSFQASVNLANANFYFEDVALDGETLALGYINNPAFGAEPGFVRIFENIGTTNRTLSTISATIHRSDMVAGTVDNFGHTLALDGNTLAVGQVFGTLAASSLTPNDHSVYLYENLGGNWSTATETILRASNIINSTNDGEGFGRSLGLSGNTLVVGYERFTSGSSVGNRGVYVFERDGTWATSATPVARLVSSLSNFGFAVDIDGDQIVVGNYSSTGTDLVQVFQRQNGWQNGEINLIASLGRSDSSSENLGGYVGISGNTVIASSIATSVGGGLPPVFQFEGPFDLTSNNTFVIGPGDTINIAASSIANSLSAGTDVTLQANNDITISEAIVANNTSGDGGNLTLQAGRSILVNDSITTDNGDVTLIANDPRATQSQRDSGEGVVVLGRDASNDPVNLIVGTGTVLINGGDRFENRTGDSTPFVFDAVTPGNWLIYSSSPDPRDAPSPSGITLDARTHAPPASGLADATDRNFVVYNQNFDVNDPRPASLPAGNGFVYPVQPSVQVDVGNDSITFGETPTANLTLSGLSISGTDVTDYMIGAGDTVTPGELFMVNSTDLPNLVDTGLAGSVTTSTGGFANAGTYVGGLTATARATVTTGGVFGVDVSTGTAGDLTVAQATLNVRPDNVTRQYGTVDPAFTFTYTGLVTGDTAADIDTAPSVTSDAMIDSDVGGYTITANGGTDNNYILNITGTALLTVDPFDLTITGLTGVNRVYDATSDAQFTGTASIGALPVAGDDVTLTGTLTATASFADKNVGTGKDLVFAGYGLSGADTANYNLIFPIGVTADITAMELQIVGLTADDRVYDATTLAALQGTASVTGLAGDTVSLSGTAVGNFADKHVGDDKTVNLSGVTLTGADAGNYVLATDSGLTANVTPLDLNVTGLTADNRVYDATDAATLTGTGTVLAIAGDTVSLDGTAVGTFDDKNAGTGKSVTVSGLSLSGVDAGNYNLVFPSALTADITQADIQVNGLAAESRIYDATVVANLTGTAVVTALGSDVLTVEGAAVGSFADKNVGTGKAVTVTGLTLSGADAANYSILQPAGLTADVTARPITLTGLTVDDKVYDATTDTTTTGTAAFSGILAGDTATIDGSAASYAFEDKNAGNDKNIDISGVLITGTDAANYDATSADGFTASITPAALTISGVSAAGRVYDTTTAVVLSGGAVQGVIAGDDITLNTSGATGTLDNKNIGVDKNVTASGYVVDGVDSGNYALEQPTGLLATITAAVLNIVGINGDKTYDGLASAVLSFTGLDAVFAGDDVTVEDSAVTAAYDDKNAGTNRDITITGNYGLNGTDAGNYSLTQPVALTGDIAQRGITVEGLTIADKEYDGTRVGTIEGTGTFGGTIAGDDLQIDVGVVNVEFADKNVGEDKSVSLSGVTLTGADAANYTAATPTGITASITPLDINVDGIAADDKVYDRTSDATLTGTGNLVGAIAGDSLVLDESSRTGNFDDKNVGDDKTVTVSGLSLNGTDAGNYNLIAPQTVTASITPADVILGGLTTEDRVYDATLDVTLAGAANLDFGALTGVLEASEDVGFDGTNAIGQLDDKNVGDDKAVTVTGANLSGADAGNYNLVLPTTLTASIAVADISVENFSVASRVYDGSTNAEIVGAGTVLALGSDDLALGGSANAQFGDKNVGTGKNVDVSGFTLTGADAANYNLLPVEGVTADITAAELVLDGLVADSREYDGTTAAPISGSLNVNSFAGDSVSVTGQISANFDDKNVGENRAVTVSGLSLSGSDAGNYTLTIPELMASITARNLTVLGIVAEDRVYDGTTDALLGGDVSLSGTIAGDNVGFDASTLVGSFDDKNVGDDKLITLTGEGGLTGSDAGNYVVRDLPFGLTANVTPLAIDVMGVVAQDREYDGTLDAQLEGGALNDVIQGDDVSLDTANASGQFVDRNAAEDIQVNADGYAIVGDDALNYTLNQPQNLFASISARVLEILGLSVADKFFDGNTDAVIAGGSLSGVITGDDVSLTGSGTGQFLDPEIGDGKDVVVSGFTLDGADATNYVISSDPQARGNILRELEIITDIIPPEVLRANSEEAIAEERQALTEFANAQEDTLVVIDYEQFNDEVRSGIVVNVPIQAILDTPVEQQDLVTKNYIAVATEAKGATQYAQNMAWEYRRFARIYKESGQELNKNVRDLQVENGLRDNFVQQIDLATTELAKLDDNLAQIQQAKDRITRYRQRIREAARLGLGAEVAEYEQVILDAEAVVATEAQVQAERAKMAETLAENQADLEESETKITELTERQDELEETIKESEQAVANLRKETEVAKKKAADLAEKMAEAKEAGARAYAERAKNLAESKAKAESELSTLIELRKTPIAEETAAALVDQDVTVKLYADKLADAKQVTETIGAKLSETLKPAALSYAQELANRVNSGGTLDDPKVMRDQLVQSVPELAQLQAQYDAKLAAQQQKLAAMEERIRSAGTNARNSINYQLATDKEAYVAQSESNYREILNNRIGALTNNGLDLSSVPTTDASGRVIPDIERLSIAILNKQLYPPKGPTQGQIDSARTAVNMGLAPQSALDGLLAQKQSTDQQEIEFANGMQKRMSGLVAQELGFSPEQALNDPNLVVNEAQERLPFNSDGSIDKDQLAENLKDVGAAYVRLKGSMKDQALKQAAEQDPTGTLKIYTNAEEAARAEFVKEYGAQPEELFIQKAQQRVDDYKNADSPEAIMQLYMEDSIGGQGNIEAAKAAYESIKAGDNPVDVLKNMANARSSAEGGAAANEEAARAAKTAMAMESAAIAAAEDADKTGLFKASNTIKGAGEKEFAAVFGGTPQELGVEALENPGAALAKVKDTASDIFTTPDGAANVASLGISTASNMMDATIAAAEQQIDNFASKLGGPGKAAAFVAKHGITAATEAKDFLQDLGSTLTGGLISKSGPSKSEVEAAVAYQKAQNELSVAKAQKERDDFLLEYIQIAQDMAKLKYELAVGVNNAKQQVGQYVMAAKQEGDRQQYHTAVRETTERALRDLVSNELEDKVTYAQTKVNELGQSPEEIAAKAAVWGS